LWNIVGSGATLSLNHCIFFWADFLDRKSQEGFDLKSFIFSQEPSEWGFGVSEAFCESDQIIDITDDLTGKPSELAEQNIPMYVNEVGHDNNLKHTVHSRENNDRTVEYYLKIDTPMKQGDTTEIFVDYFDVYESVRERKGYGLANMTGAEKSDDDLATRILRNFVERDEMKEIIGDMDLMSVHAMLEGVDSLHEKLTEVIQSFVNKTLKFNSVPSDCPLALQIVALRRLHWLASIFQDRLDFFTKDDVVNQFVTEIGAKFRAGITGQCYNVISHLGQFSWSTLYDVVSGFPNLDDKDGVNIKQFLEAEMVEEICYEVKDAVKAPLNGAIWCEIATDLTKRLCLATASIQWRDEADSSHKTTQLLQCYQSEALRAARLICSRANLDGLAFHAPFDRDCGIDGTDLSGVNLSSFPAGTKVVVQRVAAGSTPEGDHKGDLQGTAKGTAKEINQAESLDVQETWYLCWQVILMVDAFASKFLKESPYSLKDLCSSIGVDENLALAIIRKGIKLKEKTRIEQPRRKKTKSYSTPRASQAPLRAKSPSARPHKSLFWTIIWPCLRDKLGWILEHGSRPNDWYACPPGVRRGGGFKSRVDFFDSTAQVLDVLKERTRWSEREEIQEMLAEYKACDELYQRLKGTKMLKSLGSDEEKLNWLRTEAKKSLTPPS
jgi:hypothetical protein